MSIFGVKVQLKIAVEVSVWLSVTGPLSVLSNIVKTALLKFTQIRSFVMSTLHVLVCVMVALLLVPMVW